MTNQVLETIKARRTTRAYLADQIKKEELEAIIEAGLFAPSGHNEQSWHFTVVQNKELLDELNFEAKEAGKKSEIEFINKMSHNENLNIFYGAPTIIIVSGKRDNLVPKIDCAAAIQNMLLAAESLDIGACWNGLVSLAFAGEKKDYITEKLQIPEGYDSYYAVTLGYKKVKGQKAPARKEGAVTYL